MPRISQLPSLVAADGNDEIAIVDSSAATTKKITREDFLKGSDLPNDTVTTNAIADGAVTAPKLAQSARPQFKVGDFTTGSTTGNLSVSGVGFRPRLVEFEWISSSSNGLIGSGGMDEDGNQWAKSTYVQGSNQNTESSTDRCFITTGASGTNRAAQFVSMDNDGFTINFIQLVADTEVGYKAYG